MQTNLRLQRAPSNDVQHLQEELIAVKLREAEANLSLKELRQKVNEIETYWEVRVIVVVSHWLLVDLCSCASRMSATGVARWSEHQTCHRKVTGLSPGRSDGRIFFSRVSFLR